MWAPYVSTKSLFPTPSSTRYTTRTPLPPPLLPHYRRYLLAPTMFIVASVRWAATLHAAYACWLTTPLGKSRMDEWDDERGTTASCCGSLEGLSVCDRFYWFNLVSTGQLDGRPGLYCFNHA